jgi:hypothetical protein
MENSEKNLFGDDAPHWYVAVSDRWVGPMSASDIYKRILAHQLTWAHFVWKKGQADWKRICDTKAFQVAAPQEPPKTIQKQIKDAIKPTAKSNGPRKGASPPPPREETGELQSWYLHYNDTQFGPFSTDDVNGFLSVGKINRRVHAWHDGMENWERLERIDEFQNKPEAATPPRLPQSKASLPKLPAGKSSSGKSAAGKTSRTFTDPFGDTAMDSDADPFSDPFDRPTMSDESPSNKRDAPRRPLVAKILISDETNVIVGVCRDISIGGLQVLTEPISVKVGTKLKMNISPAGTQGGIRLEPFVAEGTVVRILEDGRGFSFRFQRLSERARQAIEAYIESPV